MWPLIFYIIIRSFSSVILLSQTKFLVDDDNDYDDYDTCNETAG